MAAWRLEKDGCEVTIIEQSPVVGGLISTRNHSMGSVETAANGLLASALVEELFEDCKLVPQRPRKQAKRRYLAVDGRVTRLPLTLKELGGALFKAFRLRSTPPQPGETLKEWGNRAIGPAVTSKIISTAMLGIYASDASELSATSILGRLFNRNQITVKGKLRGTVSAEGGLGVLLSNLRSHLLSRGVTIQTSCHADSDTVLAARSAGPVILAVSAWQAASILADAAWSPALKLLAEKLSEIESIGLVSLTLFFNSKPPRLGFGTLFSQTPPHGEPDGILGCLQNSEIFEGRVHQSSHAVLHSETWILGGRSRGEVILEHSDDELLKLIFEKRDRLIQSQSHERLVGHDISRWPRAIPFYSTAHEQLLPELDNVVDGTILFGNYLGDLGLASILERTRELSRKVNSI